MKYLPFILLIFAMLLELPAQEVNTGHVVLSEKNPVAPGAEYLWTESKTPTFALSAKNAAITNTPLSYNFPAAINSGNLLPEEEDWEADYPSHSYQANDAAADSLILREQLAQYDDENNFTGAQSGFKYHLTSTDIHSFLNYSTYGKQFLKGTKLWTGIGVGMMSGLMLMPRSVTRWEDDFARKALRNLNETFSSPPVWDQDHWSLNYVGHPYAGSIYYNTLRCQGATPLQSVIFSAFISTAWEYLYEGTAERPSIQDLVITPVVGSILGELTHQATLGMKKNGCNFFEKVFIIVLNPVHAVFQGYHQ